MVNIFIVRIVDRIISQPQSIFMVLNYFTMFLAIFFIIGTCMFPENESSIKKKIVNVDYVGYSRRNMYLIFSWHGKYL